MSDQSIMVNNFNAPSDGVYSFVAKPIDISNLSDLTIRFDAAFAKYNITNNDVLRVKISNDCGETWLVRRTVNTNALASVSDTVATVFVPGSNDEWKEHTILSIPSQFYVENFMVMFEFESGGGNNIYIDNIQIGHPDELSIYKENSNDRIQLYPNPAKNQITLEGLDASLNTQIYLVDAQGKKWLTKYTEMQSSILIPLQGLSKGVYSCHLLNSNGIIIKKFVIL
jgi:hypothetical protein